MVRFISLGFPHQYECEVVPFVRGQGPTHVYPDGSDGSLEGFVVEVTPKLGAPWCGVFRPGAGELSGAFGHPDENRLCVISDGAAYIVNALAPLAYQLVECGSVCDVRAILEANLLVFASYTELAAHDKDGMRWQTARLSYDGITITEVTTEELKGIAWDAESERDVEFVVDVRTGSHKGGASPDTLISTP